MDKLLVVFTGGTIGSKSDNSVINVDENTGYELIRAFRNAAEFIEIDFDTIQPLNILSENLIPAHWETLNNAIAEIDLKKYKGIIITHGSDTLPYTTAIFSYLLKDIALPVVFTASNFSIDNPDSNGIENFTAAVQFILSASLPGIYSVFKNDKGKIIVYLGTRLLEADFIKDQYKSYQDVDFGEMKDGRFICNSQPANPSLNEIKSRTRSLKVNRLTIHNNIVSILPYPGLDYTIFRFDQKKPSAILHGLYHSSTACIEPDENSLVVFAKTCKRLGIDLYLFDCCNYMNEKIYLTGKELIQTGAYTLTGISYEAALAKLYAAYNQTKIDPPKYMMHNICHEYIISDS